MIPSVMDSSCQSPGEREIYQRLRDDPGAAEWIVLHSLDVAEHRRQISGEVDFVIIIPHKGVLFLEVKACSRLERDEQGRWYYGTDPKPDPRGPFKQASESMHSIHRQIVRKRPDLSRVVVWSGVVFPYVPFDMASPEWHPWQVIDTNVYRRQSIATAIERVIDKARSFLVGQRTAAWFDPGSNEPDPQQCQAIAEVLRPHFEFYESPKAQAERRSDEVKHYTIAQYGALDAMAASPRVLFSGPAGSGKTLLAIEAARRSRSLGRRVLLICFNHLLARWLQDQVESLRPMIQASTLHARMLAVAGGKGDGTLESEYWETELPTLATEKILAAEGDEFTFDEVIVDEAQDILRDSFLDFLDVSLRGGLAAGRWRMFGDFEKQAIFDSARPDVESTLNARCGPVYPYVLRDNCRNTPRIAAYARILGQLDPDYAHVLRPDDGVEPELLFFKTAEQQHELLVQTLESLYDQGFRGRDVVVLSPRAAGSAVLLSAKPWADRIKPFEAAREGEIGYASIHAFKGLEAGAIIVTDIDRIRDEASVALFYIATTRALHRLVILANESVKKDVREALVRPTRSQ